MTTRPWRVEKPEDELIQFGSHQIGGRPTIRIWAESAPPDSNLFREVALVADEDDANLIVRAFNHHEELVGTVGKLLDQIQVMGFLTGGKITEEEHEARALLEKLND